ncbi:LysR family transcriptional regulator [Jidongwangia harbinensis]|uniref:LysR family transcriptional regulator n=1 Tax=Jidongwangia harbinensis TaxID=2878561 RepID=UPI001CD9D0DB|nr:LysR family transcriptional regulator [Jidongwangia harbinensis]MCA2212753.1 LysR family transcriptional regulator [Jidongwangia harbinensis]
MDVQVRQLRTLLAVVDAGTFTDAAAVLGVTQASVSRSVAALETTLGVRVLERSTRHVAVTAVGAKVVDQARRVLAEVGHLQQIVDSAHTEIRVGYAWAALGRHTRRLQKTWARSRPDVPLLFVHANDPTAGLSDGRADVAVIRRPLADPRFRTAPVGREARYAAVATDHTLARRRSLRLADLARYTVAIDTRTGTTTPDLWPAGTAPTSTRATSSMEDWLTQIALGQVVGITSEATAHQNPRPGVAYRAVRDAPPIEVSIAWWADNPPARLDELLALARDVFRGPSGAAAEVPRRP